MELVGTAHPTKELLKSNWWALPTLPSLSGLIKPIMLELQDYLNFSAKINAEAMEKEFLCLLEQGCVPKHWDTFVSNPATWLGQWTSPISALNIPQISCPPTCHSP